MLDLETKSAIDSNKLLVQHQATNRKLKTGLRWSKIIQDIGGGEYSGYREFFNTLYIRYVNMRTKT